ncbi:MAG: hypothetical protein K5888_08995 [Lachnospiraceae bacterium]|nr:hypothetical protein [Lachnospiraceae bacterium]
MDLQKLKAKEKKLRQKQKNRYSDSRDAKIRKIHKKRMKGVVKNSTVLSSIARIPAYAAMFLGLLVAVDRFEENFKKERKLKGERASSRR